MAEPLPRLYLARHGETAWSALGRHTGRTDISLTARGEQNAARLSDRLKGLHFSQIWTSPLLRARRTCELAGFGDVASIDPDLVEWDYGQYEGRTTAEIRQQNPGWRLFRDGAPGGESIDQLSARADRVIARARDQNANVLIFSSGHFLRVLAARWLGMEPAAGRFFALATASLSVLGYEHNCDEPAILLWDEQ